jgi:hypothetical protein
MSVSCCCSDTIKAEVDHGAGHTTRVWCAQRPGMARARCRSQRCMTTRTCPMELVTVVMWEEFCTIILVPSSSHGCQSLVWHKVVATPGTWRYSAQLHMQHFMMLLLNLGDTIGMHHLLLVIKHSFVEVWEGKMIVHRNMHFFHTVRWI